jgi:hypothetical protein
LEVVVSQRVSVVLSSTALVVALLGITPIGDAARSAVEAVAFGSIALSGAAPNFTGI